MSDIMERLRGLADLFEAGDAPRHVVLHMRAGADEIERLRSRLEIDPSHPYDGIYCRDETIRGLEKQIANLLNALADARTESMRLRAALESVMVGGNSLAQIIGADHPPHGTPYGEALAYYGSGVKYEAWCCWNTIMQARAALEEGRT